MSRPVAHLLWFPDNSDPLSIWAKWIGAADHYTLSWGDGTSQRLLWNQPPVRHTYLTAGQYALLAERGLTHDETISATALAVVRSTLEPQATATLLGDGRTISMGLETLPAPLHYRIDWGDGTHTEHTTTTPAPAHTYPWEFGRPSIVVRDVPSQRWATVAGPDIGPKPEPADLVPEWTFHHTFLPTGRESQPTAIRGAFHGRHLRPGARYGIRLNWSSTPDTTYAWAVADADGRAVATIPDVDAGWIAQSAQWYNPWRWCLAFEHDREQRTFHYVPVTTRTDGLAPERGLTVVYGIDPHNPRRVQVQVQKPQPGTYRIQWGDGSADNVECDGAVCCAWHTYKAGLSSVYVTVTGPNSEHGKVKIGSADIQEPYVSRNDDILGVRMRTHINAAQGGPATPVIARWGDARDNAAPHSDGLPLQQCALNISGVTPVDHWYRNESRGQRVTIHVSVPLRNPHTTTVTIPTVATRAVVDDGLVTPPIQLDGSPNEPGGATLHAEWETTSEWDGGYSGAIVITNPGPRLPGWDITFELDEPGVLREVWPSTAHMSASGDGRWRVWSNTPLERDATVRVGARIEPAGQPRPYPRELVARPTSGASQT